MDAKAWGRVGFIMGWGEETSPICGFFINITLKKRSWHAGCL